MSDRERDRLGHVRDMLERVTDMPISHDCMCYALDQCPMDLEPLLKTWVAYAEHFRGLEMHLTDCNRDTFADRCKYGELEGITQCPALMLQPPPFPLTTTAFVNGYEEAISDVRSLIMAMTKGEQHG